MPEKDWRREKKGEITWYKHILKIAEQVNQDPEKPQYDF